jgi:hypothetical protein
MITTADCIQFGSLLVALIALIFQQNRLFTEVDKSEKRNANKLKIFFLCKDTARTEIEIIQFYKGMDPDKKIDETEIKKTIYEMLRDETLRYRSNGTFKARRNKAVDEEVES